MNLLFPKRCIVCGKEGSFICAACFINKPYIMPPVCPLCGRPQPSGVMCPDCVSWQADIDAIRSPFRFEGTVKQAVYQLKYRNLRAIAPFLAGLMADYLEMYPVTGDVLVPVPLHRSRYRARGYNQSFLLAEGLAGRLGLPVESRVLVKTRTGTPQAKTTSVHERKANVAGSFSCIGTGLAGREVILVDDVATSGATLNACAKALKEAGATTVTGLTFAREI